MPEKSVSPTQVAVVRCQSYDQAAVDDAVRRGIELLGGAGMFARCGERILFKPNVLWGTNPAKCVITHPAVLRASITAFVPTAAALQYGDAPAVIQQTAPTMKKCGYDRVLAGLPVEVVSFDTGDEVDFPDGIAGKRLRIARPVLAADGIINVPKLKTHGLTRMTGAVKNCFGCVPGMIKGQYHARFPDVYDFSKLIADIAAFVHPRLHIMDAIEAMEGNGPQSGTPKKLGVLLLSTDPVALDGTACRLIDLDPGYVPTIAAAAAAGLGTADPRAIELVGDDLNALVDRTFSVVRMPPARLPANGILRGIRRFFLPRPVIIRKKCIRCGRCVSACPVQPQALEHPDKKRQPVYNYRRCIRCYCCQEVCPSRAIVIRRTIAGRLLPIVPYISLLVARSRSRSHSRRK